MEPRTKLTEDEEVEALNRELEKQNRSFEEDHSVEMAEQADRIADAKTEQADIALEEQSEDDPFLKAELEREGRIPT